MRRYRFMNLLRMFREPLRVQQSERGQVIVLAALMLVVILGFVALSVDAGYLMSQKRGVQAAADGAAMAADKAYQRNEESAINSTAFQYAADSGFPGSENGISVVPSSEEENKCVWVEIEHDVTRFFVGAIYTGDWQVAAEAKACTRMVAQSYALIALDPDGSGIFGSGTARVIMNSGGVMSNSVADYCGTVEFILADGPLDAYDGIDICNNADVQYESINPAAAQIPDPYAHVPQPNCSTMPIIDDPTITSIKASDPIDIPAFTPGYYPNGIDVKGEHNLTFLPGEYCFGGDFSASAGISQPQHYEGDGVIFFFEDPAELDMQGQGVHVDFSGHSSYADIVVFYQREPVCHDGELWLTGNEMVIDGAIYAACALLHLGGNTGSSLTGQVVVAEIDLLGGSDLVVNFDSSVETMIPMVYLVE